MKKTVAILLTALMLFALASCAMTGTAKTPTKIDKIENTPAPAPQDPISEEDARNAGVYIEEKRVSFAAAGDNIIYTSTWTDARNHAAKNGSNAEYDFKPIYKNVADIISSADISYINQETLMTGGANSAYPYFNSPQQLGHDLVELGFDVVSIANNHMLDQKSSGLLATIDFWRSTDAALVGGYKNSSELDNITIVEKNGIKIAFLAYTEHTNMISLEAGSEVAIPYFDEELIRRQTKAAREAADIVIVAAHWGEEYTQTPSEFQKKQAELFAECEVDVVLGSHSHSLQPIVELKCPSGKNMLCIYSLGNFLNAMDRPVNMLGGILTFDIVKPEVGNVRIENVVLLPVVCHFGPSWYNSCLYLFEDYTEALAKEHYVDLTLSALKAFATNVIDAKYLPESFK